jgi:hypothetical protein
MKPAGDSDEVGQGGGSDRERVNGVSLRWPRQAWRSSRCGVCAGTRRLAQAFGRYGRGGRAPRRQWWDHRRCRDVDRRVSRVRVMDPRHPLYGECYPVSERRSGRGPGLIVVLLPDGRERSIPRAATAPASVSNGELATASRHAHISVRTLLPLANHVRAVLASRDADLEGGGGRDLKQPAVGRDEDGGDADKPVVAASGRDAAPIGAAGRAARATPSTAVRPVRGGRPC